MWLIHHLAWFTLAALFIALLAWLNAFDARVTRAAHEQYCADVAVWQAEAARGIHPTRRTGHPDWREIAAEECPGLRPAELARN